MSRTFIVIIMVALFAGLGCYLYQQHLSEPAREAAKWDEVFQRGEFKRDVNDTSMPPTASISELRLTAPSGKVFYYTVMVFHNDINMADTTMAMKTRAWNAVGIQVKTEWYKTAPGYQWLFDNERSERPYLSFVDEAGNQVRMFTCPDEDTGYQELVLRGEMQAYGGKAQLIK